MVRALWFVLAGMGIVFATLIALVLVMTALNRWFTPPAAPATGQGGARSAEKPRAGSG